MNALAKASVSILFAASAASAFATNGGHKPEPKPQPQPQPVPTKIYNNPANTNNVTVKPSLNQDQHQYQTQDQSQWQKATATSGAESTSNATANGGAGGAGGAGGNASSTTGPSNAASNIGDINNTMSNNYKAPKPMGNVAGAYLVNNSDCGEGFSLFLSAPYLGIGGGHMKQSEVCLSQRAATSLINAGVVKGDDGMIAVGVASLGKIHPEIEAAIELVYNNMTTECWDRARKMSAIMLASKDLDCAKVNEAFKQYSAAIPAPVPAPSETGSKLEIENHIWIDNGPRVAPRAPARKPKAAPKAKDPCVEVILPERQACIARGVAEKQGYKFVEPKTPATPAPVVK